MEARPDPSQHQHLAPPARPRRQGREATHPKVTKAQATQAKMTHTKITQAKVNTKPSANTRTKPRSKWPEVQVSTEL